MGTIKTIVFSIVTSMGILMSIAMAYKPTNTILQKMDTIIERMEILIDTKGENFRDEILIVLDTYSSRYQGNERAQFIVSYISKEIRKDVKNLDNQTIPMLELTPRIGDSPDVTDGIPHIQNNQVSPDDVYDEYMSQIVSIEGLVDAASRSSFPGARAFELDENTPMNPAAVIRGREFGHIHANPGRGSLHIVLSEEDAEEIVDTGRGVYHPFAINGSIPGMVMVFAPRNEEEIPIMISIIRASYEFSKLE